MELDNRPDCHVWEGSCSKDIKSNIYFCILTTVRVKTSIQEMALKPNWENMKRIFFRRINSQTYAIRYRAFWPLESIIIPMSSCIACMQSQTSVSKHPPALPLAWVIQVMVLSQVSPHSQLGWSLNYGMGHCSRRWHVEVIVGGTDWSLPNRPTPGLEEACSSWRLAFLSSRQSLL